MNIRTLAIIADMSEKKIRNRVRTSLLSVADLSVWYNSTGNFPTKSQEKMIRSWGVDHVLKILKRYKKMENKKIRVHESCKCSACGKSQEDGVKVYDYYMFGEGRFCNQCRTPDDRKGNNNIKTN